MMMMMMMMSIYNAQMSILNECSVRIGRLSK